ncbi:MAG: phospholipase D-like domain-containing protein, partial [Myxococcota bacterium]
MKHFPAFLLLTILAASTQIGCESSSGNSASVHKLFVVSDDGGMKNTLLSLIGDAGDIRLTIYELNDPDIVNALVQARQRDAGVHVVFNYWSWNPLDGGTDQNNRNVPDSGTVATKDVFGSAAPPVPWVNAIPYYYVTHQKTFAFDGRSAMVMSLNLQPTYFGGTRDFAVYTTDPGEVGEIMTVFNNDYAQQVLPKSDLDAGSLVWSSSTEGNSRTKLIGLIGSAKKSVYAYSEEIASVDSYEMGDAGILNAFIKQAEKGQDVRLITAMMGNPGDPSSDPNFDTRCYLN